MLGLTDPGVILAYLFMVGGTILCVVYGALNWNKSD